MFDPDLHLTTLRQTHPRLLFYLSCGDNLLSCVLTMPYDVFVLSDYFPQTKSSRSNFWHKVESEAYNHSLPLSLVYSTVRTRVFQFDGKWGFLFFQDNNEVLDRIAHSPFRISAFVGIGDGCAEGGNYECVNQMPFLGKVLLASMPEMDYFANHSPILEDPEQFPLLGHRYFRESVSLALEGKPSFKFLLQNILYHRNNYDCQNPNSYCTLHSAYYRTHAELPYDHRHETQDLRPNRSPLWKLLRFRTDRNEGIIAQYLVQPMGEQGGQSTQTATLPQRPPV